MIPTSKPKLNTHPWCIVWQLPNMQRLVVARFHRRGDADGYIQICGGCCRRLNTRSFLIWLGPRNCQKCDRIRFNVVIDRWGRSYLMISAIVFHRISAHWAERSVALSVVEGSKGRSVLYNISRVSASFNSYDPRSTNNYPSATSNLISICINF